MRGDATVVGITDDSRAVRRGWAFLATRGTRRDGHAFVDAAVAAGASAVVVDRPVEVDVPRLQVPSVRAAAGPLAAEFFDHPSRHLSIVGVTGTNGKTTTCELVRACIDEAGWTSGLIGTIETRVGAWSGPSRLTTPGAVELQRTLSAMVDSGVDA
ncbi:MAG TPA: Mur ligase family protein, partial [Acidimicrobiales bacterium]|nr:Mur ligase family protein [Acidimicrobiales bacterium]